MIQRFLLALLAVILAACAPHPTPPAGHDWRVTPATGGHMWKFEFESSAGGPVTTYEATQAQVTAAGLTITLDEWGGNKDASWSGLTGPPGQRWRVRIFLEVGGTWKRLFSGVVVRTPSGATSSSFEAVGDKYLRMKEVPVERENSGGGQTGPGVDASAAMRQLVAEAAADLAHLTAPTATAPDAGALTKRDHNGESLAAALDALISVKSGWGWTTLPDDRLYVGPPPTAAVTVDEGAVGVRVTLRDVVTEGMRNSVRWVLTLQDKRQVVYRSDHASVVTLGRSGVTRYIDARSLQGATEDVPAAYEVGYANGVWQSVGTGPGDPHRRLRDGLTSTGSVAMGDKVRTTLTEHADWIDVSIRQTGAGAQGRVTIHHNDPAETITQYVFPDRMGPASVQLPARAPAGQAVVPLYPGAVIMVDQIGTGSSPVNTEELNPRRLNHVVLDAAAETYYNLPADHAGVVSIPGYHDMPGSVTVTRRAGRPAITEKLVGVRYLIREPIRTEYLIGEPDVSVDSQVLKVLVDRRDEETLNQAVNTTGAG